LGVQALVGPLRFRFAAVLVALGVFEFDPEAVGYEAPFCGGVVFVSVVDRIAWRRRRRGAWGDA